MTTQHLYMLRGLSGSGKSTYAVNLVTNSGGTVKRVNKDLLREMLDGGKWSKGREQHIIGVRNTIISYLLDEGFSVVCDDTNLAPQHETTLRTIAKDHGVNFECIDFTHVPYEQCVANDLNRVNSVGEQVIKRQWLQHLCPPLREPVHGLPWCVIVDLDGTLADHSHRSPYDASTCEDDGVREHVVAAVEGLCNFAPVSPTRVFAFSGRADTYRQETHNWLDDVIHVHTLGMRRAGDTRKDAVIKRELFEYYIEGKYNVFAVVDDRPQVLRQWRELGLPTIDVSAQMGLEF